MSAEREQIDFEISFRGDHLVTIESDGCSLTSEYFAEKNATRTTMSPVSIFYSAFAL